jgi:transposase
LRLGPGVGPLFASVFVAEIGDVTRFRSPAHGQDSPRSTTSPTERRAGARLPNRDLVSFAGRRSKRRNAKRITPSCGLTLPASPLITATAPVLARSPASPWHERSSPSSTTAFATAPSVPRPSRRRRDAEATPQGAW